MSKIELARLYPRTRNDGAVVLSGRMGFNGMLRVLPNPDFDPDNPRSPSFIAYLEEAPEKAAQPYRGPQLQAPQAPRPVAQSRPAPALRAPQSDYPFADSYIEGEIVS